MRRTDKSKRWDKQKSNTKGRMKKLTYKHPLYGRIKRNVGPVTDETATLNQ